MVATDQNSSMISMMKKATKEATGTEREPTYAEIADAKVMLSRALAPHCSGLLVDGFYGYASTVAAFAVPPGTGLLIRVEKSGSGKNAAGGSIGEIEPGWGVGKIKRCGADAVKLLAMFEPDEPDSAERNFQFTLDIYDECIKHDILFLLEPLHFPMKINGVEESKDKVAGRKAKTVIDTAKYLSRYCDIYKSEFPGTPGVESDAQAMDNLKRLNDACGQKPWVLLSAGVDYDKYKKQVEMAMKAGASGILGGRAFWKEFFTYNSPADRQRSSPRPSASSVEGNRRDREVRYAVVREIRADDGRPCTASARRKAGTPGTAAAPLVKGTKRPVGPRTRCIDSFIVVRGDSLRQVRFAIQTRWKRVTTNENNHGFVSPVGMAGVLAWSFVSSALRQVWRAVYSGRVPSRLSSGRPQPPRPGSFFVHDFAARVPCTSPR